MAAARLAVDAAEQLVRDPAPLLDLLTEAVRAGRGPADGPPNEPAPASGGVERITVRPPADDGGGPEPP